MRFKIAIPTLIIAVLLAVGFSMRPVQAQEVEPKCLIQNGNTNGDNLLDISDAVHLLSFLYLGGSEPMPQYVADVDCVTTLGEELAVAKTDLAQSQQALAEAQAEASAAKAALSECQGALAVRDADIAGYQATIAARDAELATTRQTLQQSQADLAACSSDLEATRAERDAANQQLAGANASLLACTGDLATTTAQLATSNSDLATTQAALGTCQGQLTIITETLTQTQAELAAKTTTLEACSAQLSTVQAELVTCLATGGNRGLPDTGQTKCYDAVGTEIPCYSAEYPGQDGAYQAGCPNEGRFVDHGDGTVTDTCTGLLWQKDTADITGDGKIDETDRLNWQDSLKYCESLVLAGHDDWRLPNVRELQSIVDYGRYPSIYDPFFKGLSSNYWSSSTIGVSTDYAWDVPFSDGDLHYGRKTNEYYVRAVRFAREKEAGDSWTNPIGMKMV